MRSRIVVLSFPPGRVPVARPVLLNLPLSNSLKCLSGLINKLPSQTKKTKKGKNGWLPFFSHYAFLRITSVTSWASSLNSLMIFSCTKCIAAWVMGQTRIWETRVVPFDTGNHLVNLGQSVSTHYIRSNQWLTKAPTLPQILLSLYSATKL